MQLTVSTVQQGLARLGQTASRAGRIQVPAITPKIVAALATATTKFRRANLHRRAWKIATFFSGATGLAMLGNLTAFLINFDVKEQAHDLLIHGAISCAVLIITLITGGKWRHWRNIRQEVAKDLHKELGVTAGRAIYDQLLATGSPLPEPAP